MHNKLTSIVMALAILLMISPSLFAKEAYYNLAEKGLNLRESPSIWGTHLALIPFGEQVAIVGDCETPPLGTPVEVQEMEDFIISGNWKKVRYQDQIGYVFEGYLSKFPAPALANNEPISEDRFLDEIIGGTSEQYNVLTEQDPNTEHEHTYGYEQKYNRGIHKIVRLEEFRGTTELIIPNISLREAYLISRALYFPPDNSMEYTFDKRMKRFSLHLKEPDAGCSYTIEQFGDGVRIKSICGC